MYCLIMIKPKFETTKSLGTTEGSAVPVRVVVQEEMVRSIEGQRKAGTSRSV